MNSTNNNNNNNNNNKWPRRPVTSHYYYDSLWPENNSAIISKINCVCSFHPVSDVYTLFDVVIHIRSRELITNKVTYMQLPCSRVITQWEVIASGVTCLTCQSYGISERVAVYQQLTGGVRFIDVIPKLPSGKILRRKLRESLSPLVPSHKL